MEQSPPARQSPMIDVFVYGTLKRGGRYHAAYCRGVESIADATVVGRLFALPAGYPMLVVPEASILARASGQAETDLAKMAAIQASDVQGPHLFEPPWRAIRGELLRFADPGVLVRLDRLEEFIPGGGGLYERVIVATLGPQGQAVWTYVAPGGQLPAGAVEAGESWPTTS